MDIEPASLAQVDRMRDGRMVLIEDDVASVVRQLQEIDAGLRVRYSESQGIFVVYHVTLDALGNEVEQLVTTAQQLDGRIVARMKEISGRGYDFAAELERVNDEADRRRDREFTEKLGPIAERLQFALKRDLGRHEVVNSRVSRAVVPADIPKSGGS